MDKDAENPDAAAVEAAGFATADGAAAGTTADAPFDAQVFLASSSPRRRELLEQEGVSFEVRTPQTPVDETLSPEEMRDPRKACKILAERKAASLVQEILAEQPVGTFVIISADTMVVKGTQTFGKPKNLDDAKRMLRELSGCTHDVVTGVSVWVISAPQADSVSIGRKTFYDVSHVTFKDLSDDDIADYLRKGESFDKAGAYAIQGAGAALIDHYEGSLNTIIGLPTELLVREVPCLALCTSFPH